MIRISDEVREALREGRAVVALESTIVAHGMPYPDNLRTGQLLEQTVRDHGAVPATIAVIDGALAVGISAAELERIASEKTVEKVSRRDLPFVIASRALGATTVSATMIGAARAGIAVFATGGIGGVHREVNETFDISADLAELGRTNVCVVCAGAKSILDLPRTLEVLETLGVPVVGWGTNELPAFFTRTSGIALERRVDDAAQMARVLDAKWTLGLEGGVVLAVPPPESAALAQSDIDPVIAAALEKAHALGIRGKATTPFLLREIREATAGKSLATNIALAVQNARVAAEVAVAYAALRCR
jgi:pseudouridine-5'-phosphate glycosidase